MAAIGFVLFFAFIACLVSIFGLLTNCLFEFGIEPLIKRRINRHKFKQMERLPRWDAVRVYPPTTAQILLAERQSCIPGQKPDFSAESVKAAKKDADNLGYLEYEIPYGSEVPKNFLRYGRRNFISKSSDYAKKNHNCVV